MPPLLPRPHALLAVVAVLLTALLAAATPASAADGAEIVPGEVVVGFAAQAGSDDRVAAREAAEVETVATLGSAQTQLVRTDAPVAEAVEDLERQPGVAYAEPNFVVRAAAPSDPRFGQQWGLLNTGQVRRSVAGTAGADSGASRAWSITTGSPAVIVGIVDSGVDLDHPDLAANIWTNPAPGTTGCGLADVHGCDFTTLVPNGNPDDDNGHGTHVAGIVGAAADNAIGVAGVCWGCRLLPAQALRADGYGSTASVAAAISYATQRGARVVNLSLGSASDSSAVRNAIRDAPHVLFVAAAGNGDDDGNPINVDADPEYPCATNVANIVCVAATDHRDLLASWSNHGSRNVDLAAPGVDVVSTYRGGAYASMDGTSMATPFVTGAAALAFSARPTATVAEVKAALLATATPRAGLLGRTVSGGRLDAAALLGQLTGTTPPAPGAGAGEDPTPVVDPGTPPPVDPAPGPVSTPVPPAPAPAPPTSAPPSHAPSAGASPAPAPGQSAQPAPVDRTAVLPRPARRGVLDRRVAVVRLSCPAGGAATWCEGRLSLRARLAARAGGHTRLRAIGARAYTLAPGTSATYRVAVGSAAARGDARRVVVHATVTAGTRSATSTVTLRRRPR